MSNKVTKMLRIEHKQHFANINTAKTEANAIKIFAQRSAIKNNAAVKLLIGISETNIRGSTPTLSLNGRRGRPKKIFVAKYHLKTMKEVMPHLHIILYGCPAQTLANKIVENINKRYRKQQLSANNAVVSRSWRCDKGYIPYVINQSTYLRQVNHDPKGLLNDLDFKQECEKKKSELF